jgi:hypothetical protein
LETLPGTASVSELDATFTCSQRPLADARGSGVQSGTTSEWKNEEEPRRTFELIRKMADSTNSLANVAGVPKDENRKPID